MSIERGLPIQAIPPSLVVSPCEQSEGAKDHGATKLENAADRCESTRQGTILASLRTVFARGSQVVNRFTTDGGKKSVAHTKTIVALEIMVCVSGAKLDSARQKVLRLYVGLVTGGGGGLDSVADTGYPPPSPLYVEKALVPATRSL